MCRHATQQLPPEPHSTAASRAFLRGCFEEWELLDIVDDAQLALSELVTNALLHAGTPLVVSVSAGASQVEIAVFDGDPSPPVLRPQRRDLAADLAQVLAAEGATAETLDERDPRLHVGPAGSVAGGRGLLLVDALAAEWGYSPVSNGKAVWVKTAAPDPWAPGDGCFCAADGATTLASGARVTHRG